MGQKSDENERRRISHPQPESLLFGGGRSFQIAFGISLGVNSTE
jgi:hypothetical protein